MNKRHSVWCKAKKLTILSVFFISGINNRLEVKNDKCAWIGFFQNTGGEQITEINELGLYSL